MERHLYTVGSQAEMMDEPAIPVQPFFLAAPGPRPP